MSVFKWVKELEGGGYREHTAYFFHLLCRTLRGDQATLPCTVHKLNPNYSGDSLVPVMSACTSFNPRPVNANLRCEQLYLGGFKQQIPIPCCDLEGVAIGYAIGTDLAVREGLQGLGLTLPIQRHRRSSDTQPQLLGKTSSRTLERARCQKSTELAR